MLDERAYQSSRANREPADRLAGEGDTSWRLARSRSLLSLADKMKNAVYLVFGLLLGCASQQAGTKSARPPAVANLFLSESELKLTQEVWQQFDKARLRVKETTVAWTEQEAVQTKAIQGMLEATAGIIRKLGDQPGFPLRFSSSDAEVIKSIARLDGIMGRLHQTGTDEYWFVAQVQNGKAKILRYHIRKVDGQWTAVNDYYLQPAPEPGPG